jgi:hypothetical protein
VGNPYRLGGQLVAGKGTWDIKSVAAGSILTGQTVQIPNINTDGASNTVSRMASALSNLGRNLGMKEVDFDSISTTLRVSFDTADSLDISESEWNPIVQSFVDTFESIDPHLQQNFISLVSNNTANIED